MQIAAPTTRRLSGIALVSASAFGLFAQSASAGAILPDKGVSPGAETSITLVIALSVLATLIFAAVAVLVLTGLRKSDENAIERSSTAVKTGGVVAFVVLAAVGAFAYSSTATPDEATAKLNLAGYEPLATTDPKSPSAVLRNPRSVDVPEGDYLRVYVNGQQYLWRYTYIIDGKPVYSYETLVVPTGVPVLLDVTASDVVHSWWVPAVGGKIDAVPGYVNQAWLKIDEPGVFKGSSTGISGVNYANETITVKAVPPAEFVKWVAKQRAEIDAGLAGLARYRALESQKEALDGTTGEGGSK